MLELSDTQPEFEVLESEYNRLLGLPRDYEVEGRLRELADWARAWYREHGRPWWYAREVKRVAIDPQGVTIDGTVFASSELRGRLERAEADSAILVAVSAGGECETEARRRWLEGKPDEYFFLEVFGSAVVEALVAAASYRLCAWADDHGLAVLPHYSPGYPEWDIAEQQALLDRVAAGAGYEFGDRLRAMSTGMLHPKKALLAVFGVTRHLDRVERLTSLVPCANCALRGCRYRRAPYRHPMPAVERVAPARPAAAMGSESRSTAPALTRDASYSLGAAALAKWSRDRLQIETGPDRTIEARFRYDGTTCSNLGHPLAFEYHVRLSSPEDGYVITDARCVPAPGDVGHTYMCEYLVEEDALLETIAGERPLVGRPLDAVLGWRREHTPSGCYCDPAGRDHKWGMVLEVLHYALARSGAASQTT